jgi:hypothetical protein
MTRRERRLVAVYAVTVVVLGGVLAWAIANCSC